MIKFHRSGEALSLQVYVKPGSRKREARGEYDGALCICVTAPPEKGKANREVLNVVSEAVGISKSAVRIVRGETSRKKVIEIFDARTLAEKRLLEIVARAGSL